MGIGIRISPLPETRREQDQNTNGSLKENKASIFAFPHLFLGMMTLFFYVGAEVIAGDTRIHYGLSLGIKMELAKGFTSFTMITMVIGYLIGISLIPGFIDQRKALLISAILGQIFTLGAVFHPDSHQ